MAYEGSEDCEGCVDDVYSVEDVCSVEDVYSVDDVEDVDDVYHAFASLFVKKHGLLLHFQFLYFIFAFSS